MSSQRWTATPTLANHREIEVTIAIGGFDDFLIDGIASCLGIRVNGRRIVEFVLFPADLLDFWIDF